MHVIRHEAVRNYSEVILCGSSRNLPECKVDDGGVHEQVAASIRAKREGISMKADVVECLQMAWGLREHAGLQANPDPDDLGKARTVWSKPDTTEGWRRAHGLVEARHYRRLPTRARSG